MDKVYFIESDYGVFRAAWTAAGLYHLQLPGPEPPPDFKTTPTDDPRHAALERMLKGYLGGQTVDFGVIPVDRSGYTPFQRCVLDVVATIPPGRTFSYRRVAERVGNPGAGRAVGNAVGANRTPVIIPCHRVIRSDGRIGGFSGGAGWKERLLTIEGNRLYSGGIVAV